MHSDPHTSLCSLLMMDKWKCTHYHKLFLSVLKSRFLQHTNYYDLSLTSSCILLRTKSMWSGTQPAKKKPSVTRDRVWYQCCVWTSDGGCRTWDCFSVCSPGTHAHQSLWNQCIPDWSLEESGKRSQNQMWTSLWIQVIKFNRSHYFLTFCSIAILCCTFSAPLVSEVLFPFIFPTGIHFSSLH